MKSCFFIVAAAFLAFFVAACAKSAAVRTTDDGATADAQHVQSLLDQDGQRIDYDTLMQVYEKMTRSPRPVIHLDRLISQLIHQRNPNPRIDQIILILAARIIGHSTVFIPDAGALFVSILEQEDRLNEWVLAFVAEAIADYPFNLPEGDTVADLAEAKLDVVRSRDRSGEEYFGHHFLPPPRSQFIQDYINSIGDMRTRVQERNRYYRLIRSKMREEEIEAAMMHLKKQGMPISGNPCPLLLQCLSDNLPLLPFGN